jgi:hypothetical protein
MPAGMSTPAGGPAHLVEDIEDGEDACAKVNPAEVAVHDVCGACMGGMGADGQRYSHVAASPGRNSMYLGGRMRARGALHPPLAMLPGNAFAPGS